MPLRSDEMRRRLDREDQLMERPRARLRCEGTVVEAHRAEIDLRSRLCRRRHKHDVRHSYATAALNAGVAVKVLSQRLGHADVGVTLRIYAHVLPGDDEAASDLAANAIFGATGL